MLNDDVVDAEQAFMGMAISDGSGTGNVLLWNPWNSGKVLYLDRVIIAGDANVGADIRFVKSVFGTLSINPPRNKDINGPTPVIQVYTISSNPPADYPYNRPIQEIWLGGTNNDRAYPFDPAIKIPQGRGVVVAMAGTSKCILSYQGRQKDDPLGSVSDPASSPPPSGSLISPSLGTVVSEDLSNPQNAFDSNDTTYANDPSPNDPSNDNWSIGKIWSSSTTVARFVLKSPSGRSFSAANPGRTYTWSLEKYDGTSWSVAQSGSFTEPGSTTQAVLDVTLTATSTALGHRVRLQESAASSQQVATLEFYTP